MTISNYEKELSELAETYSAALDAPEEEVEKLKAAIRSISESSLIGVGSGGSFTTASFLCNLHESYTGRISRPSSPLEIICKPTLASSSPVFLISAEGKNPDICEALERARRHSARTLHVLTNRNESELMRCVDRLSDVTPHVFPLANKDGYLATNSLLFDSVLIARAYTELDKNKNKLPNNFNELKMEEKTVDQWSEGVQSFAEEAGKRGALTIIYSPLLKPIATDLESKLSESALLHVQLADLRSYAHGRHLWLANRPKDCAILALVEPSVGELWCCMKAVFPVDVPTFTMSLEDATPKNLIAGLIAQMYLVSSVAKIQGRDISRPIVPQFVKSLHYLDLPSIILSPVEAQGAAVQSKLEALGARWPLDLNSMSMQRAHSAFVKDVASREFRAVVFDYDGTLCSSQRTEVSPLSARMLREIERLVRAGIVVGIASGRGGSVQEALKENLPNEVVEKIQLGLYSCGWIENASVPPNQESTASEFLSHVARIVLRLKKIGVPINTIKPTHPYQVSIRFRDGLSTDAMWFVIGDALRQAGLDVSSMVRSKHSIDVLAPGISKAKLVAHIITSSKIEPYDIMTIGDQGAWPGNDSSLLEHRYSLSVDEPSRRLDRGWKLAPAHKRDVDATLWYLDRFVAVGDARFKISL